MLLEYHWPSVTVNSVSVTLAKLIKEPVKKFKSNVSSDGLLLHIP